VVGVRSSAGEPKRAAPQAVCRAAGARRMYASGTRAVTRRCYVAWARRVVAAFCARSVARLGTAALRQQLGMSRANRACAAAMSANLRTNVLGGQCRVVAGCGGSSVRGERAFWRCPRASVRAKEVLQRGGSPEQTAARRRRPARHNVRVQNRRFRCLVEGGGGGPAAANSGAVLRLKEGVGKKGNKQVVGMAAKCPSCQQRAVTSRREMFYRPQERGSPAWRRYRQRYSRIGVVEWFTPFEGRLSQTVATRMWHAGHGGGWERPGETPFGYGGGSAGGVGSPRAKWRGGARCQRRQASRALEALCGGASPG